MARINLRSPLLSAALILFSASAITIVPAATRAPNSAAYAVESGAAVDLPFDGEMKITQEWWGSSHRGDALDMVGHGSTLSPEIVAMGDGRIEPWNCRYTSKTDAGFRLVTDAGVTFTYIHLDNKTVPWAQLETNGWRVKKGDYLGKLFPYSYDTGVMRISGTQTYENLTYGIDTCGYASSGQHLHLGSSNRGLTADGYNLATVKVGDILKSTNDVPATPAFAPYTYIQDDPRIYEYGRLVYRDGVRVGSERYIDCYKNPYPYAAYRGDFCRTFADPTGTRIDEARWDLKIPEKGWYNVYVYIPGTKSVATVRYYLQVGGVTIDTVDVKQANHTGWVKLGRYSLGTNLVIRSFDNRAWPYMYSIGWDAAMLKKVR